MKVFVTGAAGYIGSHTVIELVSAGHTVIGCDNFKNSSRAVMERVEKITGQQIKFFEGDIRDKIFLTNIFQTEQPDAVIHFAALKSVAQSFEQCEEYFDVNVGGTRVLLEVMAEFGVKKFVYSSSACVYGVPEKNPIPETAPLQPTNPYGETKVAAEKLLEACAVQDEKFSVVILRYFNPVGANASALIGEFPKNPANIAPIIMEVLRSVRPVVKINGADYETPDGTCVRDFIHVVDLAGAHVSALEYAAGHAGAHIYNVGTGRGYSVKEIIAAFSAAVGREIPVEIGPRRAGDVAVVVADPTRITAELGWHGARSLQDIAESSVAWITKNPRGFEI